MIPYIPPIEYRTYKYGSKGLTHTINITRHRRMMVEYAELNEDSESDFLSWYKLHEEVIGTAEKLIFLERYGRRV